MIEWLKSIWLDVHLLSVEFDLEDICCVDILNISMPNFRGSLLRLSVDLWTMDPEAAEAIIKRIKENDDENRIDDAALKQLKADLADNSDRGFYWDVLFLRQFVKDD